MPVSTPSAPWWAVATAEEVSSKKPLSVDVGEQPIVLWRDTAGVVRALEDRCPHRRAPLSRGCVRDNGWIQCGYHGWSYDGATGRLTEVPNMKDNQKFPPLYKAIAFAVEETAGFVRVCIDGAAPLSSGAARSATLPFSGTTHVALPHEHYVAALFDDPGLLMSIRGLSFTPYLMSELRIENGWLAMERSCQRRALHWPAAFSPEFPMTLQTATHPVTGETRLTLRDEQLREHLRAVLAPVPAPRGVTAVRWRAERVAGRTGLAALALGFGNPFAVHSTIDGAALRELKPTVSLHGAELRAELLATNAAAAA